MSYSISLNGHTENRDQVKAIFRETVRQLRAVPGTSGVYGSLSDNDGVVKAEEVPDEEVTATETSPVEEDDVEEEEASPEDTEG